MIYNSRTRLRGCYMPESDFNYEKIYNFGFIQICMELSSQIILHCEVHNFPVSKSSSNQLAIVPVIHILYLRTGI